MTIKLRHLVESIKKHSNNAEIYNALVIYLTSIGYTLLSLEELKGISNCLDNVLLNKGLDRSISDNDYRVLHYDFLDFLTRILNTASFKENAHMESMCVILNIIDSLDLATEKDKKMFNDIKHRYYNMQPSSNTE